MVDRPPPRGWHRIGVGSFTVVGVGCVLGTFLPWLRSGTRWRSSYDLFSLLDRLDIAPRGAVGMLVRWWPIVPLLVAVSVVLLWWRRVLLGLVAALVAAAYVGGVSVAMTVAAADEPIDVGIGPVVCTVGSVLLVANAVVLQITTRLRPEGVAGPPVPSPHADSR